MMKSIDIHRGKRAMMPMTAIHSSTKRMIARHRGMMAILPMTLLAACTVPVPVPPPAPQPSRPSAPATTTSSREAEIRDMAARVNRFRASIGCPALTWSDSVARVAQAHSDDMARRNYFAHRSPEGSGPRERLTAAGLTPQRMGENIAMGDERAQGTLAQWTGSPGHRENLADCAYTHHGIGMRDGRWTHVFITPWPAR